MELIEAIKTRRSVRKFNNKKIDINTVKEIVDICQYSPSWKNTQTVRYNYVETKDLIEKISDGVGSDWNKNILKQAQGIMVLSTINNISGYEKDGTPSTTKGSHFESFDAGIYADAFVLACHNFNIGTVIMGIYNEANIKKILNLPEGESVSCIIPMGYYDEKPASPKKKLNDVVLRIK
ncbi:MAG: nitroreductase family protein [Acholeplasmatales bacterium]|nr:nitroreductase family protein [Acholeplasmatales bacterium]